jgi:iron complex outermembrane receptor protein
MPPRQTSWVIPRACSQDGTVVVRPLNREGIVLSKASFFRISLLCTTSCLFVTLCAPVLQRAAAQDVTPVPAEQRGTPQKAKQAVAKDKQAAKGPEEVLVTGSKFPSAGAGLLVMSRALKSSVASTRDYILTQPSTANAERLIELQPGIVVAAQDPYGVEPGNITVRGLNLNEVSWLFEFSPLVNDGTFNSTEAADPLNIEEVRLNPGTANFDVPGSSGAAGSVNIVLHNPTHQPGGLFDFSYGSYNSHQTFLRLDSGDIGSTGLRAFMSYSNFHGDDWRGPGDITRQHVDAKVVKDWGDRSQTSLSLTYTKLNYQLERPPTLAQWQADGNKFNYDADFAKGDTNYYKLHQNVYNGVFATLNNRFQLTDRVFLDITPYTYFAETVSPAGVDLSAKSAYSGTQKISDLDLVNTHNGSSSANDLLYSNTPSNYNRSGINASVVIDLDSHNKFTIGDWYAFTELHQIGQFNYLDSSGSPYTLFGGDGTAVKLSNGQVYHFADNLQRIQTNVAYVGDRAQYFDGALALEAGFRFMTYRGQDYNRIPGVPYNVDNNQTAPMPSVGARYNIDKHSQIFFDAGDNVRTPDPSEMAASVSATTGKVSSVAGRDIKIENSIVEELGYRYDDRYLAAQATFFNYNFTNRQVSTAVTQNGALVTQYINAGGQTSRGLDVSIGSKPLYHFSLFASGEYLHATIDNNLQSNGSYLPTAGKTATGSPEWTGSVALNYDDGLFFGNIQARYVDSQYATFTNDQKMPSYATADMSLGRRLPSIGFVKVPTVRLNILNLANTQYLTGIYATQFNATTTRATNGKSISGTQPTYIVGAGIAAVLSVSASF